MSVYNTSIRESEEGGSFEAFLDLTDPVSKPKQKKKKSVKKNTCVETSHCTS